MRQRGDRQPDYMTAVLGACVVAVIVTALLLASPVGLTVLLFLSLFL